MPSERTDAAPLPETVEAGLARRRAAVGRRVEALMDARRMSYSDAARATGLSRTGLFKIVDGSSDPTLSSLLRIVDFFGVSLGDLLTEAPPAADRDATRPPSGTTREGR